MNCCNLYWNPNPVCAPLIQNYLGHLKAQCAALKIPASYEEEPSNAVVLVIGGIVSVIFGLVLIAKQSINYQQRYRQIIFHYHPAERYTKTGQIVKLLNAIFLLFVGIIGISAGFNDNLIINAERPYHVGCYNAVQDVANRILFNSTL